MAIAKGAMTVTRDAFTSRPARSSSLPARPTRRRRVYAASLRPHHSPLVIARWSSVGASPGASFDGVTSLDGNICTNAGARRTRSTSVRSSTIDVYWSAPPSGVFAFTTTSSSLRRHIAPSPAIRLSSGDQLSAHVPFSLMPQTPSSVFRNSVWLPRRVPRRAQEHHAVAEREIPRGQRDAVHANASLPVGDEPRALVRVEIVPVVPLARGASSVAFGNRGVARAVLPSRGATAEVLGVEVIERDVVDVRAARIPSRPSCASSGSNVSTRRFVARSPNWPTSRAKNGVARAASMSVGLKRSVFERPLLEKLHEHGAVGHHDERGRRARGGVEGVLRRVEQRRQRERPDRHDARARRRSDRAVARRRPAPRASVDPRTRPARQRRDREAVVAPGPWRAVIEHGSARGEPLSELASEGEVPPLLPAAEHRDGRRRRRRRPCCRSRRCRSRRTPPTRARCRCRRSP